MTDSVGEVSRRTVTNYEMSRRAAMTDATSRLMDAMVLKGSKTLTAMEWGWVLADLQQRVHAMGLNEEWGVEVENQEIKTEVK